LSCKDITPIEAIKMNDIQLAALERFALHDRNEALASSVWAPGSAEQAFFTGM
jgi:hypothetical protein